MPGAVTRAGVINPTTCLNGRPFRGDLIRRMGEPIAFANDANCFALAEATFGAGRGHEVVFGVILGTGVGGGIVLPTRTTLCRPDLADRCWDAAGMGRGIAGEWGHVTIDPEGPPATADGAAASRPTSAAQALEADYRQRGGQALPLRDIANAAQAGRSARQRRPAERDALVWARPGHRHQHPRPRRHRAGRRRVAARLLVRRRPRRVSRWVFTDELTTPIVRHQIGDAAGVLGAALAHFQPALTAEGSR